jgi:hypothetical protein
MGIFTCNYPPTCLPFPPTFCWLQSASPGTAVSEQPDSAVLALAVSPEDAGDGDGDGDREADGVQRPQDERQRLPADEVHRKEL